MASRYQQQELSGYDDRRFCSGMLSDDDVALLERNRPKLMRVVDLEGSDLLAQLSVREVLRLEQEDIIESMPSETQRIGKLLNFLQKGKADTVDLFIEALEASGQEHVASFLKLARHTSGNSDDCSSSLHTSNTCLQDPASNMTSKLGTVESLVECPICLEDFKVPCVLSCLHTLCRDCLEKYVSTSKQEDKFSCPFCRHEYQIPEAGLSAMLKKFSLNSS